MSSKAKKAKKNPVLSKWEVMALAMEYVLAVTLAVMCVAVSFYTKEGYNQIGNAKFAAYRVVMIIGFSIFLMMGAAYLVYFLRQKKAWKLSITDWCVLAYLLFSTISVVSGGFYKDALWGYFGWNMGWMSQLSFVLIYLAVSRFGKYYRNILTALLLSSAVVFFIAVLHRMLIDPIGFYEGLEGYQMAQFLSTMGQATWYASYLVVTLPVGIAVFLFSEKKWQSILGGIYTAVGFASLVTQNSDSAYFALAGFMLIFFLFSIEKRETLNRFAEACTLFFAAGKVMYFLMQIHPNPDLEYDFVTDLILNGKITWVLLGLCLLLDLFLYLRRNRPYSAVRMQWIRWVALIGTAVCLIVMVGLIVLQTKGVFSGRLGEALGTVSYFNWNREWGNGRGKIWEFSVKVFAQESLPHKLFGLGPDCFSSYLEANHTEEVNLYWGKKMLTNAHNEWLTTLINVGILGAAAYIGIFVTAIRRFAKAWQKDYLLAGVAASAVSYMAYNFFCYQQVCCTPFIFLLLGIGEYLLRQEEAMK